MPASNLEDLKTRLADVNALRAAISIMDWDQQTYMPEGGAEARANHVSRLSRMAHEMFTDEGIGAALNSASPDSQEDADILRVVRRDYDLATKLPAEFVAEKTRLSAVSHEDWVKARANNDFAAFAPTLTRMFEIAKEEAKYLGHTDGEIYDVLLDQYEEGATTAEVRAMFDQIREPQVALVKEIAAKGSVDDSALTIPSYDRTALKGFTEAIISEIGFDMSRGRQDVAPHPFCTGWSVGDIRLTTRYKDYVPSAIFGSLHEAGHGVYEQGSPKEWDGTPLAGGVSLGLHESQSRLWENIVGRSLPFWRRNFDKLATAVPELRPLGVDGFYRLVNKVEPSLIRVEADELTYNLHIMVRFEIENAILNDQLRVSDLPDAWNAKYEEYLGITPPTDTLGCLQDVHWSMGSIGYFPTYTMGNILSYQIWNKLRADVGDTDVLIERGEFAPILNWLRERIYAKGRSVPPKELVKQVVGGPMDTADYLAGLDRKYRALFLS